MGWGSKPGRLGGDWRWPKNGGREHEKPRAGGLGLGAAGCLGQEETGTAVGGGRPGGKIPTDLEELHSAAPRM